MVGEWVDPRCCRYGVKREAVYQSGPYHEVSSPLIWKVADTRAIAKER